MRRFPNGDPGQSRSGLSSAFPRTPRSLRGGWRRLGPCPSGLLWDRPLAGRGGPTRESQSHRRAQRRNAVARHGGAETLPRRIRAGNLAHAFHGAWQDPGRDGRCFLRRGLLQQARLDSRRSSTGSDSRPRTAYPEHCRRNQSRRCCPGTRKGPSRDSCDHKSPYPPRSPALAKAREGPGPRHRAHRRGRSLRSAALVAHSMWCAKSWAC